MSSEFYVTWDGGEWGPYIDPQVAENARELAWQMKYPNPRVEERRDLTKAMCRESTEGWDGTPDGPDPCRCTSPRPVPFYGRTICAGCDGDIEEDEDTFDPIADAAQYRDEKGEN